MENIELRKFSEAVKFDNDSRLVEGYALLFNHESKDLGFIEIIEPTAITQELINKSDVWALLDHNENLKLARSNRGIGNLALTLDEKGLKYSFKALNNQLGNDLLEYLNSGMITESSFSFTVGKDGQKWEKVNGIYKRTLSKLNGLFDVSPVWNGAYSDTAVSVAKRSLDAIKEAEKQDLTEYFKNLKSWQRA